MAYSTQGVRFDGTNDWMERDAALTGAADSPRCLISFWVKFNGGDGNYQQIFEDENSGSVIQFSRTHANTLAIILRDPPETGGGLQTSSSNFDVAAGWMHVLYSWDMSVGSSPYGVGTVNRFMVNDVDEWSGAPGFSGGVNMDFTRPDWTFGARLGGSLKCNMDIADFYLNTATSMDLSVEANRRKFISATGSVVDLGSDGSTPTGSAPIIFLKGPASGFATNLGTGGGFTLTGTLADGDSPPADVDGGGALPSKMNHLRRQRI